MGEPGRHRAKLACVGGGFIWQMGTILNPGGNFSESGCANKKIGMSDFFEAIR
jgi:hypothetical protein